MRPRPWLVFAGTEVALIDADDERQAIGLWRAHRTPGNEVWGQLKVGDDELRARPLRPDDEEWIMAHFAETHSKESARFVRALASLKAAC